MATTAVPLSGNDVPSLVEALNATVPSQPVEDKAPLVEDTPAAEPEVKAVEPELGVTLDDDPFADEPEEEAAQQETPVTEPKADDDPLVDKGTLETLLKTSRGKTIYEGHRYARQLEKPWDQGGIGHRPTVEQVRQNFAVTQQFNALVEDVQSGDAARAANAINWLTDPRRPNSEVIENHIVNRVMSNEKHLSHITDTVLGNVMQAAWERKDTDAFNALQTAYKAIYGDYRKFDQPQAATDPREATLTQREQQLRERETNIQRTQEQAWAAQRDPALNKRLTARIHQALKPVESAKETAPKLYERAVKDFADEVRQRIVKEPAMAAFRQAEAEAKRTGNVDALIPAFESLVLPHIRHLRTQFIEEFGKLAVQQNGAEHAALRRSAAKTTPTGSGPATTQSIAANLKREPGESEVEWVRRRLHA